MGRAGRLRLSLARAALLLASPLLACGTVSGPGGGGAGEGVLFVGNSLTAANDLPGMVAALSEAAGARIPTAAVTVGGASLEDHWRAGTARARIERGGWSAVVVQQGPSTLPESRAHLVQWTEVYAGAVRGVGAMPHVYMVWPPAGGDWDAGIESYRLAARGSGSVLLPVAEALRIALARDPRLPLLADDGFHPAPMGTYLAALVIVARLTGRSPVGLPRELPGRVSVDAATAAVLQEAAAEALRLHP